LKFNARVELAGKSGGILKENMTVGIPLYKKAKDDLISLCKARRKLVQVNNMVQLFFLFVN